MTQVAFGVWDGVVREANSPASEADAPEYALKGFDEFDPGNPIKTFLGDRGFFVFDDSVSLIDALDHYMTKAAEQSCGA